MKSKKINYADLRTALTPQQAKHEAAFLFDEKRCASQFNPGVEVADALFKLLDAKTTHSILSGELRDDKDELARPLLAEAAVVAKDLDFSHPCFCFVLYVNNLSEGALGKIHEGLKAHPAYLGYVPCTFSSIAKTFVSMGLANLGIKHKDMVILGHEDDRDNSENCNLHLHDYEASAFKVRSLQSMYFHTFLSYKPEQILLEETDDDLEIAIRAMSQTVAPLELGKLSVVIDEDKFEKYLKTHKLGKLTNAGLHELSRADLEEAIRQKLRSSYIYNLDWRDEAKYQASLFNIMLEFQKEGGYPERIVASLEYKPVEQVLRLVTMT
ncbi:hypothetical protein KTE71_28930 [Burkholderia multivorans]|uniref:hypothetical protein n=1 Tax=Burkholderia multivorans TaxID=87883 RepID=UPI001C269AB0|nr:hypothetical protein [Burkholderia multivorans]MBU9391521.1 hypothetical protein [Burkholderia multivorans]